MNLALVMNKVVKANLELEVNTVTKDAEALKVILGVDRNLFKEK